MTLLGTKLSKRGPWSCLPDSFLQWSSNVLKRAHDHSYQAQTDRFRPFGEDLGALARAAAIAKRAWTRRPFLGYLF